MEIVKIVDLVSFFLNIILFSLFLKTPKFSYINSKSNNTSLYEIEELKELKPIFGTSYSSVFETEVGLIHCPDGINEICHDDYGKEYDKHGPLYFVRIDNGKFITIFEQVE